MLELVGNARWFHNYLRENSKNAVSVPVEKLTAKIRKNWLDLVVAKNISQYI